VNFPALSGFRPQVSGFRLLLLLLLVPFTAHAHGLTFTKVEAAFNRPGEVDITVDYNLALVLPQPGAYYALTQSSPETQQAAVQRALPEILTALTFFAGDVPLKPELKSFALPRLPEVAFNDPAIDKSSLLRFTAKLPAAGGALVLVVPYAAKIDHPVLFTATIPATGSLARSWIEEGATEPFEWIMPAGGVVRAPAGATATPPWYAELWVYLKLGFKHIVPEGLDHILFVLALFFLGLNWRNLIAQTTVFTVAHATTLFLSRYGVISLPGHIVEPLIAFSIAAIALENIWRPKLGPARLALVFAFGLVHGLGFAGSIAEVEFPRDQFVLALLGFNFGVDFGQLFVIGVAFLLVGWWRDKPWFRNRVTVPCCLAIAGTGLFWTVQRIFF